MKAITMTCILCLLQQPHERDTEKIRKKYNISDSDMIKYSEEVRVQ